MTLYTQIHPSDNVAVALQTLPEGTLIQVAGISLQLVETIPAGHKIALKNFSAGEEVVKYGFPIGRTVTSIPAGGWVNEHNIHTGLSGICDYVYAPAPLSDEREPVIDVPTFMGYRRKPYRLFHHEFLAVHDVDALLQL